VIAKRALGGVDFQHIKDRKEGALKEDMDHDQISFCQG
jgi:hypothetical protein